MIQFKCTVYIHLLTHLQSGSRAGSIDFRGKIMMVQDHTRNSRMASCILIASNPQVSGVILEKTRPGLLKDIAQRLSES